MADIFRAFFATSSTSQIACELATRRHEIEHQEHLYYVLDAPEISDTEYDKLVNCLKAIEAEHRPMRLPVAVLDRYSFSRSSLRPGPIPANVQPATQLLHLFQVQHRGERKSLGRQSESLNALIQSP